MYSWYNQHTQIYLYYIHVKNYLTHQENEDKIQTNIELVWRGMSVELITNTKILKQQLEINNIKDYNSKIRDQNVIIKVKQIYSIDLEHVLNWSNLKKLINPY